MPFPLKAHRSMSLIQLQRLYLYLYTYTGGVHTLDYYYFFKVIPFETVCRYIVSFGRRWGVEVMSRFWHAYMPCCWRQNDKLFFYYGTNFHFLPPTKKNTRSFFFFALRRLPLSRCSPIRNSHLDEADANVGICRIQTRF